MISTSKLRELLDEEADMNRQRLEHCNRCHTAIKSDTVTWDKDRPIAVYQPPLTCPVCRDDDYDAEPSEKKAKPSPEKALLCLCKYVGCEVEFYSRPSWYKRQQSIVRSTGNPWMPVLIDKDLAKTEALLQEEELVSIRNTD